jgi:hypothetical protein
MPGTMALVITRSVTDAVQAMIDAKQRKCLTFISICVIALAFKDAFRCD